MLKTSVSDPDQIRMGPAIDGRLDSDPGPEDKERAK
jgi:hypothetical protein